MNTTERVHRSTGSQRRGDGDPAKTMRKCRHLRELTSRDSGRRTRSITRAKLARRAELVDRSAPFERICHQTYMMATDLAGSDEMDDNRKIFSVIISVSLPHSMVMTYLHISPIHSINRPHLRRSESIHDIAAARGNIEAGGEEALFGPPAAS